MRAGLVRMLATGAAVGFLVGTAGAAQAAPPAGPTTDINIDLDDIPARAAGVTQQCHPHLGGKRSPDRDVWVFDLPAKGREFVSVTVTFRMPGDDDIDVTIRNGPNGGIVRQGTSKAYVVLPAGYLLITGTAAVTGNPEPGLEFALSHACAAADAPPAGAPTPPAGAPTPPAAPPAGGPGPERDRPERYDDGAAPGSGREPGPDAISASPTPPAVEGELPVTGPGGPLGALVTVGLAAVTVGALVILTYRRRDAEA